MSPSIAKLLPSSLNMSGATSFPIPNAARARLPFTVVSDDDSVVVERVVPAPPRKRTQLDEDISRHLKHFAEV